MAYDPVKAHEYYEKYRKKGLKKGRKKGRKKSTSKKVKQQTLIGLSTSGLNDAGKMNWAMAKKDLQDQMNAEIANASSDEEKAKIRAEYQNKALQTLQSMKSDPSLAQAKSSSAKSSTTSSSSRNKTTRASSRSGSSRGGSTQNRTTSRTPSEKVAQTSIGDIGLSSTINRSSRKSESGIKITSRTNSKNSSSSKNKTNMLEMVSQIQSQLDEIRSKLDSLTTEQKEEIRSRIESVINDLRSRVKNELIQEQTGEIYGLRARIHK